jgi:hypothetical protein
MYILNEIQIWPIDAILHIYQGNLRELPFMYASGRCNNNVCEHIIRDAYDKRFTKIKATRTYVLSAKIEQSGLAKRNIWFCQQNWIIRYEKLDHPDFPDIAY